MDIKSFRQRGALFIEYALLLAFVLAAGAIFFSSNGAVNSIQNIFAQTEERLSLAASEGKSKYKTLTPSDNKLSRYLTKDGKIVLGARSATEGELNLTSEPVSLAIGDNINIDFTTADYCYAGYQKGITKDQYLLSYYVAKDNGDGTYTKLIDTSWIKGNEANKINSYGSITIGEDAVYSVKADGSTKKLAGTDFNASDNLVFMATMKDYSAYNNAKADIQQKYIDQAVGSIKISSGK